jgi:integrase
MHEHFRPLLGFLVGTGARFGEAAGSLAKHVHLDAPKPYIEIRVVLKWVRKKWRLGRPKTASSVRWISLSPKLVELLRTSMVDRAADDHAFTMIEAGPLHHGNFHKRYFRPAVEAAGGRVPRKLRIHDLRHTHAAWLLSAGAPLIVVQRRLGHSTIVTTSDIYGHLTPEADKRSLRIVDYYLPDCFLGPDARVSTVKLSASEAALPEYDVDDLDDLAA